MESDSRFVARVNSLTAVVLFSLVEEDAECCEGCCWCCDGGGGGGDAVVVVVVVGLTGGVAGVTVGVNGCCCSCWSCCGIMVEETCSSDILIDIGVCGICVCSGVGGVTGEETEWKNTPLDRLRFNKSSFEFDANEATLDRFKRRRLGPDGGAGSNGSALGTLAEPGNGVANANGLPGLDMLWVSMINGCGRSDGVVVEVVVVVVVVVVVRAANGFDGSSATGEPEDVELWYNRRVSDFG